MAEKRVRILSVEINKILHEKIGVVPDTLGFRNVERAIEQSVLRLSLNSASELAEVLKNDRKELQNFVEMIVVPETWFFRDIEPFAFIRNFAIDFKIKYGLSLIHI
ncbi:MAG: hypothetical protein IAE91_07480 [Ignavibacteriaceae bacterium]|nr:hypothetical protein [Ignavibacteriaceae bacterium]